MAQTDFLWARVRQFQCLYVLEDQDGIGTALDSSLPVL